MTDRMKYAESDFRHHTMKIRAMLADVAQHAREDISKIDNPKAQALFETTAEVLSGLSEHMSMPRRDPSRLGNSSVPPPPVLDYGTADKAKMRNATGTE